MDDDVASWKYLGDAPLYFMNLVESCQKNDLLEYTYS